VSQVSQKTESSSCSTNDTRRFILGRRWFVIPSLTPLTCVRIPMPTFDSNLKQGNSPINSIKLSRITSPTSLVHWSHDIPDKLLLSKFSINVCILHVPGFTSISYMFCNTHWLIDFLVFNATFSNISAISWRPVLSHAAASRVHPFFNLQSWARTHAVLVIGLYELLDPAI
jgi:hypothetical protein